MIKLEIEERETEYFVINPLTAETLGVEEDALLLGRNLVNQKTVAGRANIEEGMGKNKISMARSLFESIGLEIGFDIGIEPYDDDLKKLKGVEFAVKKKGSSDQDPLPTVKEEEKMFLSFVKDRIFTKYSEFLWPRKDILVSLEKTDPDLEKNDAADLSRIENIHYTSGNSGSKSFDSVLLIDISGSMETEDFEIENFKWGLERISKGVKGDLGKEFLNELKGKKKIKRSKGATFCVLIYLMEKIARDTRDKVSVVPFSTSASPIQFQGNKYLSTSEAQKDPTEDVIEGIKYAERGHTNLSKALHEAIDAMKNFEFDKMKMIVVLTDGKPNPPSIDDSQTVMKIVEKNLAPRKDVVVNTIGLGDEVDHHLMDQIARKTGGEYNFVATLQGLSEAYSRYATSISVRGRSFMD